MSSARRDLLLRYNALALLFLILFGCSSSTTPTFVESNTEQSLQEIIKQEYGLDVTAKLLDTTLWIYVPLEDIITKSDSPTTYKEQFLIKHNDVWFDGQTLNLAYQIEPVPEEEKTQEMQYAQGATEQINNVWKVLRRVAFSLEPKKRARLKFFSLVLADTKNGFVIHEIIYHEDLKKVSYNYISWTEFQHRVIQDTVVAPAVIDNKDAAHLAYREITMDEFLSRQIEQRIHSKFSKPEVTPDTNIDDAIRKVAEYTLAIYKYADFNDVGFYNLGTDQKTILNRTALFEKTKRL